MWGEKSFHLLTGMKVRQMAFLAIALGALSAATFKHLKQRQTESRLVEAQGKFRETQLRLQAREKELDSISNHKAQDSERIPSPPNSNPAVASASLKQASKELPVKRQVALTRADEERIAQISDTFSKRAAAYGRYAPFLRERGLTLDQINRYLDLTIEKESTRLDLQTLVREKGLSGDSKEITNLREQMNGPLDREMTALIGGRQARVALAEYEASWFSRQFFVNPVLPMLEIANMPLTTEQVSNFTALVAANQGAYKAHPADISNTVRVDWATVLDQASTMLSPEQVAFLRAEVLRPARK